MKQRLIVLAIVLISIFGINTVAYAGPVGGGAEPASVPICPIEADYMTVDKQP